MDRRTFVAVAGAATMAGGRAWGQAVRGGGVAAAERVWTPLAFGAVGDGQTKDTAAVQRAMDACAAAGGGVVELPGAKTFLCGSLTLRKDVELRLAAGTRMLASPDRSDYFETGALLFAKDVDGVRVSGAGVIDGNFRAFFGGEGAGRVCGSAAVSGAV